MRLRDYLLREGITITQAASQLGIHRQHLSYCMSGHRRPSIDLAQAIIDFTDGEVSQEELIKPKKPKNRCPTCNKVISDKLYHMKTMTKQELDKTLQIKGYDTTTGKVGYWKFIVVKE